MDMGLQPPMHRDCTPRRPEATARRTAVRPQELVRRSQRPTGALPWSGQESWRVTETTTAPPSPAAGRWAGPSRYTPQGTRAAGASQPVCATQAERAPGPSSRSERVGLSSRLHRATQHPADPFEKAGLPSCGAMRRPLPTSACTSQRRSSFWCNAAPPASRFSADDQSGGGRPGEPGVAMARLESSTLACCCW
eukprot:scaffold17730_cov36-Phaeocystis_antarctica.AAC.2